MRHFRSVHPTLLPRKDSIEDNYYNGSINTKRQCEDKCLLNLVRISHTVSAQEIAFSWLKNVCNAKVISRTVMATASMS